MNEVDGCAVLRLILERDSLNIYIYISVNANEILKWTIFERRAVQLPDCNQNNGTIRFD